MKVRYVYLATDYKNFKIGVTENIGRREKQISQAIGKDVSILNYAETPRAFQVEKQFHRAYAHKRLFGEWFDLDCDEMGEVDLALFLLNYDPDADIVEHVLPAPRKMEGATS